MKSFISKFLFIIGDRKKKLFHLLLLFLLISVIDAIGIGLIYPFIKLATEPSLIDKNTITAFLVNQLNLSPSYYLIPILGVVITIIFIVQSISYLFAQKYISDFIYEQKRVLTLDLMKAYLYAPYTFHLKKNTATITNTIITEVSIFCGSFLTAFLRGITNFIILIVLLLLLAKTNLFFLLLVAITILPTTLISSYISTSKVKKIGAKISKINDEIIRLINHSLGGLKDTKITGSEEFFLTTINQQAKESSKLSAAFEITVGIPPVVIKNSLIIFVVLFVSWASLDSSDKMTSIGGIMAIFGIASIRLIPAVNSLVQAIAQVRNFSYVVDRLYFDLKEIEQQQQEIDDSLARSNIKNLASESSDQSVMPFSYKLSLQNIIYQYPEVSTNAINNISFDIYKGQSIGLIGKSGSGKTTLVDIILGLLYPKSGDIQVDDVSIYQKLRAWQNLIGYIPQSIFLTDETIEKNIAFGVPDHLIDRTRLEKAIQSAQLEELMQQLPQGLKTEVGERGVRLSGGQRQRVGIARALYHEREILVLDEATSALDNETEQLVNESIKSLSGTKTMIIIAHRLSTVEHCDRLYLLGQGKILKAGTYQEVVVNPEITDNS
jgi:ABC-type bacteriocin/lantibiotic exporter with double-glycine peptidase domain